MDMMILLADLVLIKNDWLVVWTDQMKVKMR